jgi:uncharacterized peroxidase-related enzyme
VESHLEDLRAEVHELAGGEELVRALRGGHKTAELSPADRGMLDFAVKLTRTPSQVEEEDIAGLREVGFDDAAIHDIVQVVALFAYYNRLADGLGIDPEPEWGWSGRQPPAE